MPKRCHLEWCDGQLHDAQGCNETTGGWHCTTCHTADVHNNMMASNHEETGHKVGWSCGEHLVIERV